MAWAVLMRVFVFVLLVGWPLVSFLGFVSAAERKAAGELQTPTGSLLHRTIEDPDWKAVPEGGKVYTSDLLLALPGSRADIRLSGVKLSLWGNMPEFYNYPMLESAAVIEDSDDDGLDVRLRRGRLLLLGLDDKKQLVRVRFHGQLYEFTFKGGTEIGLELIARWPRGVPFKLKRKPEEVPTTLLTAFVIKGSAYLKVGNEQFRMPAHSTFSWDNINGHDRRPNRDMQLPIWVGGEAKTPQAEAMRRAVRSLQKELVGNSIDKVLAQFIASADPARRKLAVSSYAALDRLPALVGALENSKYPDVRTEAIVALRHWISQAQDHDQLLYHHLVKERQFSEADADSVLQLLHSFADSARERPETYESLIEMLRHKHLAVRELARWHLYRWVIAGRKIQYDAAGSQEERERAYKAWKKLIPTGKLPPTVKK
ncbi:MAG: hypothetical protein KatS3mg105_1612 [Gemmatales bacterium]|nr:MAG: hypothetical protein KatS3mg105_1612 [Gemmatales bacterium]